MEAKAEKRDVLQRFAGVSFIVGAIVLFVFNLLLPRTDDPANIQKYIQVIAASRGGLWEANHMLLAAGIWALMIGLTGVYRSIASGGAAVWARLGYYGVIVGTTLWTVLFALQGLGLPTVVEQWQKAAGADKATLLLVASSLAQMNLSLFSMTIITYWLALLFMGMGMALGNVHPKWLGWAIVVLGLVMVVAVGLPQAFAGASALVTNMLFPALSLLTTVWALVLGLWIARRA